MNGKVLYIILYVDDILFFGSWEEQVTYFKTLLNSNFKMKDLSLASNYLGIHMKQDLVNGKTILNQTKYLEKMLENYGMINCKDASTL